MIAALVFTLLAAQDPCADTFDATDACESPQDDTLDEGGAELGDSSYDETPQEVDAMAMGAQLLFVAGGIATVAVGFHVAQLFYVLHQNATREAGMLTTSAVDSFALANTVAGGLAAATWVGAILVAGTGVALMVFEPTDGTVALPFLRTADE